MESDLCANRIKSYLRIIGRHLTQLTAYFLAINSKRCIICSNGTQFPPQYSCMPDDKKVIRYGKWRKFKGIH